MAEEKGRSEATERAGGATEDEQGREIPWRDRSSADWNDVMEPCT